MDDDLPLPPIPPDPPPLLRFLPREEAERLGAMYGGWNADSYGGASMLVQAYWPYIAGGALILAAVLLLRR